MKPTLPAGKRTRLLIADDHTVVRSGLRALLESQPDMEVIGEAADGVEAVSRCRTLHPDIVLLDLSMPGRSGLQAIADLKHLSPAPKVLVLTMHNDETYLRHAVRGGADGYVVKQAADTELIAAIHALARNERYLQPTLAGALVHDYEHPPVQRRHDGVDPLSERERDVTTLIALGHAHKVIAEKLNISVKTVEAHRARILEKLALKTRADLVRYALERKLLTTDSRLAA